MMTFVLGVPPVCRMLILHSTLPIKMAEQTAPVALQKAAVKAAGFSCPCPLCLTLNTEEFKAHLLSGRKIRRPGTHALGERRPDVCVGTIRTSSVSCVLRRHSVQAASRILGLLRGCHSHFVRRLFPLRMSHFGGVLTEFRISVTELLMKLRKDN